MSEVIDLKARIAETVATPATLLATLTDTGNAARLVAMHGARIRYIPAWDRFLVYDGTVWHRDDNGVRVRELAKDVGYAIRREATRVEDKDLANKIFAWGQKSLSSGGISAMVSLARGIDGVLIEHTDLDTKPHLFGVSNGTVDLRTGELRSACPDDLITMQAPVMYDPDAEAPRFMAALEQWFPDPEVRDYVQRLTGAALWGEQRDHVFVIHYGGGGNGKGTFMRALRHVLGKYAVVIHLSLIEQTRHKEHDTEKAWLFRARLAVATETERRVRLAEATVKNLTGNDPIHARRMREDPWEFEPTHSLWLQTNHLPEISGRDRGIWRRIRVVRWTNTFDAKTEDQNLGDALEAEASGILAWAVRGCLAWQREGLKEPEAVLRDTIAYRDAEDVFSRFKADTGLVFRPELSIDAGDLQQLLTDWAGAEGADPPRKALKAWLEEGGAKKRQRRTGERVDGKEKRTWTWFGIGFVTGVTSSAGSQLQHTHARNKPEQSVTAVTDCDDDNYDLLERKAIQDE